MDNIYLLFLDDDINHNVVGEIANNLGHPVEVLENEERIALPRNENFYEVTIPLYTEDLFKQHFRMSRAAFNELLMVIGNAEPDLANRSIIPVEKKLLFTIWVISKPESFLAAGDRFGMARSSAHNTFKEIIQIFCNLLQRYVLWPADTTSIEEVVFPNYARSVKSPLLQAFHTKFGFPGIVGAIDGTHIEIKQPIDNSNDYYNRHGYHSIILQGICDHNLQFIDIFVGFPGRVHDSRVFRNSPVHQHIHNLPRNVHILGDSAYPLAVNVMTPFRDNGHLNANEVNYNTIHSKARSAIERAFGRLKCKFRRLKYLDIGNPDFGTKIIAAACILHNFIIRTDGVDEEVEEPMVDDNNDALEEVPAGNLGTQKRLEIAEHLL